MLVVSSVKHDVVMKMCSDLLSSQGFKERSLVHRYSRHLGCNSSAKLCDFQYLNLRKNLVGISTLDY